ncbi:MAG: helix-turn-helix transcriptional regulator [Sinobacterium sp.]|jgi:transcriptional regulator with XRE-family HTH domain|tara:strand:+ start:983 stop:1288 length:306 start_codon:yes stop_codon:yes gene_type:complete
MQSLLKQIKNRRLALALKQQDMMLRVGMSRQQYQRLESKGNPRLDTLELIAKGLQSELLFIPQEKLNSVRALLADDAETVFNDQKKSLVDDPWQGLLGDGK